jgi:exonuclease SbcC
MKYKSEADKTVIIQSEKKKVTGRIAENGVKITELQNTRDQLSSGFNPEEYLVLRKELDETRQKLAAEKQILIERKKDYEAHKTLLAAMEKTIKEIEVLEKEIAADNRTMNLLNIVRSILNSAGPPIARIYLENLSREANDLYRKVSRENVILEWREGYDVALVDNIDGRKRERVFRQFSGGEQMTAALAIRLALLKQQSRVNVGFFDEPTANLDSERRMNLAETIPLVTGGFSQIFIISHDDTFDAMTDNVIHLQKDSSDGSHISG